jgi:hypothetical protein
MSCDIDFGSKQCKNNQHDSCYGSWTGLGFHILCNCICHKIKNEATDGFERPDSAALYQVLLEVTKQND